MVASEFLTFGEMLHKAFEFSSVNTLYLDLCEKKNKSFYIAFNYGYMCSKLVVQHTHNKTLFSLICNENKCKRK